MANLVLEMVAMGLSLLGLIGASASTGMPMWKVTAFIGENIIVMETRWEGLWMNCYRQANIRMQCKVYDSLLYLPPDLQAARGLMCCSVALAGLGILLAITGMRCTSCIRGNSSAKRVVLIVAGSMMLAACLCVLIPVSWTAHVIIQDFYNPLLINAQRRELGDALYIGWVSSALLFAGGCIFTCCSISRDKEAPEGRTYPHSGALLMYPPQVLQPHPMSYSYLSRQPSLQPSFHPAMQPPIHPAIQLSRHPSSVHSAMAYL